MNWGSVEVIVITLFVVIVGAVLLNSGHKDTLLLVFGIAALIYVITEMKGQTVPMGEG